MIFFDTSALVKRYVYESGSERVDEMLEKNIMSSAISKLAYPEILAAFTRRCREGEYSKDWLDKIINNFHIEMEKVLIIELRDELLPIIRRLISKHPLKGADAVHLASALWLKDNIAVNVSFSASDLNLLKVAEIEGLKVINPME